MAKTQVQTVESKTADEDYQWDTIEAYRLNKDIIDGFLVKTFGYCEYFTQVRPSLWMRLAQLEICVDRSRVQLATDKFQFWVPRKLTEVTRLSAA